MSYEWDAAKARENLSKHGVRFAEAAAVLEDDLALTMRDPFSEDEDCWITVGKNEAGRFIGRGLCLARGQRAANFSAPGYSEREESIRGAS